MIGGALDRRLGLLFVALAAIIHGSLGVTTKDVLNVAATNVYSITPLRAIVALLACLAICALLLGRRMFRIARGDVRTMVCAGLLMAFYQITFVVAISLANVTIAALVALCTVPVLAAVLSRMLLGEALRPSSVLSQAPPPAGPPKRPRARSRSSWRRRRSISSRPDSWRVLPDPAAISPAIARLTRSARAS
jgi:drug/metabolite transporter, DME family